MNVIIMKKVVRVFCIGTASFFAATVSQANPYTAQIRSGEQIFQVSDSVLSPSSLQRTFTAGSRSLYVSNVSIQPNTIDIHVVKAHPSQLGRFNVSSGKLNVFDSNGAPLWSEPLKARMCPPELLGEFVRAHWNLLQTTSPPLACLTPIIKAKKVAPLKAQRLKDLPGGQRVVEFSAGSLGMRFFMTPTRLVFAPDGNSLLSHNGQFESSATTVGSASYMRGQATYNKPREIIPLPESMFAASAEFQR
jgi:hypothetical protein